ncbi:MAG TPA: response regulator [Acidimicrobiales bacterium]|nr:response regulator [Acidimicrobiales bacterium]
MTDRGRSGSLSNRLSATTRILAVEDEADIAEFLRAYFRASGYDLIHLDPASADDVMDAVERERPDLILLDFGLRGFSGLDVYRRLRGQERFAFLPVIVVTGDATARTKTIATASGLDGFVTKPFNVNTLADLVAERIDAARAMAESGRDETLGVMTQAYLTARLTDEINSMSPGHAVSFALIQLRTLGSIQRDAGQDGVAYVVRRLIEVLRARLPEETVVGRTDTDELALLLSGPRVSDIEPQLASALAATPDEIDLPGGAAVGVELAAGLASFPEHAGSVDELYMAADAALADAVDAGADLRVAM